MGGGVCGKIMRPDLQPQTPTRIWPLLGKARQGLLCPLDIQYTEGGHGGPQLCLSAQGASSGSQLGEELQHKPVPSTGTGYHLGGALLFPEHHRTPTAGPVR